LSLTIKRPKILFFIILTQHGNFYWLTKIYAPLWLNADIIQGPVNATTKPLGENLNSQYLSAFRIIHFIFTIPISLFWFL
jgi:hypothetical protein